MMMIHCQELLMMIKSKDSEIKGQKQNQQQQLDVVPPYLDEDIITNILIKVHSAESLYNSLRYVSKPWSNIISHHPGIHLNNLLPTKPPCLIIQHRNNSSLRYLLTKTLEQVLAMSTDYSYTTCLINMDMDMDRMKEGVVQLEQQITDVTSFFKKLYIRACCNGLILATPSGIQNEETLCVINPLTNHRILLPPRPIASGAWPVAVGFVFVPSIAKYKIVTLADTTCDGSWQTYIQIITLSSSLIAAGGDSSASSFSSNDNDDLCGLWRIIEAPISLHHQPLTINGNLYWNIGYHGVELIVSFDVATESFIMIADHLLYRSIKYQHYGGFMNMGGYLAFWFFLPDEIEVQSRTFNVLVLDDIHKLGGERGGEWKQLHSGVTMDIDFIMARQGRPVSCVGNGEVIIFLNFAQKILWAYHFESNRWLKLGHDMKEEDIIHFSGFHVNKPVPFDSLYSSE